MNFLKFIFLLLIVFFVNSSFWAQEKPSHYIIKDSLNTSFSFHKTNDLKELDKELNSNGYFFYKTELTQKDSINQYIVNLGPKTSIVVIRSSSKKVATILKNKKKINYIKPKNIASFIEHISLVFDKEGRNFSETVLTNQELINDTLFCDLNIIQSQKRYINKTVVKGYKKFSKRFIKRYIHSKKPFSKKLLIETEDKINQLSFVKNLQKPAILFTKDSTHLYLYLDKVKTNKLDALIGFNNKEESSKIQFNGYIDLSLSNTLHKGETLAFKWNNSGQDQQEIDLSIDNPYIFNSPINLGYDLNIFRQDSSFVNTKQLINISYKPHYKHSIGTYYRNEQSTSLNDVNIEFQKDIIGFKYSYLNINNWRIPKAKFEIDLGYGTRKTNKATTQQTFKSDIIYNFEITANNHFYTQNRNAYLRSDNKTINELYRIGGATTMRGFLEQSIFSHLYNFTNLEYRYFNNPISFLYVFSDIGHFRDLTQQNNLLSFGLGYTLGTSSGLLKISYAVGKNQNTSFNLSNGLFHINFVTIF